MPAFWPAGAISSGVERLPYKEEVAGSSPASPTSRSGLYKPFWWRIVRLTGAGSRSKASPRHGRSAAVAVTVAVKGSAE